MISKSGRIAIKAALVAGQFAKAGTVEAGGENRGAQVERFLKSVNLGPGNPWCAAFVRHCFEKATVFVNAADPAANLALPQGFPDSGYVPHYKEWAKSSGLWIPVSSARKGLIPVSFGDLACFYFPAKGRVAHIGIVAGFFDGGVKTVEGNTGPERGEVNRDGDGVYFKDRSWSELGTLGGFVRVPDRGE